MEKPRGRPASHQGSSLSTKMLALPVSAKFDVPRPVPLLRKRMPMSSSGWARRLALPL
jgi:hypothetical protein